MPECARFVCEGQNFLEVILTVIQLVNNYPQKPSLLTRTWLDSTLYKIYVELCCQILQLCLVPSLVLFGVVWKFVGNPVCENENWYGPGWTHIQYFLLPVVCFWETTSEEVLQNIVKRKKGWELTFLFLLDMKIYGLKLDTGSMSHYHCPIFSYPMLHRQQINFLSHKS